MNNTNETEQDGKPVADGLQKEPKKKCGRKPGYRHDEETKAKISKSRQDHGHYTYLKALKAGKDIIDGRTQHGRAINTAYKALLDECGDSPTQKQVTVCDMARTKLAVLHLAGQAAMATEPGQLANKKSVLDLWLRYSESLARDFERLEKLAQQSSQQLDYYEHRRQFEADKDAKNE